MNNTRDFFRKLMASVGMWRFQELSKATGIKYDTLMDRLNNPANFRAYELNAICEALNCSSEDLYKIVTELAS